jgi:hypothetical protein
VNHKANLNVVEKETFMVPVGKTTHSDRSSISHLGECLSFFVFFIISILSLLVF